MAAIEMIAADVVGFQQYCSESYLFTSVFTTCRSSRRVENGFVFFAATC